VFPLYAPFIEKIEIVKRSKVRRAKLYFIREKVAREVKRQLRTLRMMGVSTEDFAEKVEEVAADETPVEVATAAVETEAAVEEAAEIAEVPAEEEKAVA
jgi:hypothetical protein